MAFHVEVLQDYLANANVVPVPTTPQQSPGPTPPPMLPDRQEEFASPSLTELDATPCYLGETMEVLTPQNEVPTPVEPPQPSSPPKPVAKPVAADVSLVGDGGFESLIPEIGDEGAPKSKVGIHDLSPEAIRQRSKRIFTPRADGTLKVSQKIFDEWKGKGRGRRCLEAIFKQVGYDPEPKLEIEKLYINFMLYYVNVGVAVFKLNR